MLAERGVVVSYETIRRWCRTFAQTFANRLRRRRSRPGDRWHLDEVFIRINGVQHYLWRAVDQDGVVLDVLVQSRRNTKAAKRFFKKLLKGLRDVPRVVVTDQLKSYAAAKHGQIGLVKQLAQELGPFGITVNSVAPGFMATSPDYVRQWDEWPEGFRGNFVNTIAMRRMGEPQDVADAVTFLASDHASWITGQTIPVTGNPLM